MNFREHKNVFVKCVVSRNPSNLEWPSKKLATSMI